jgi:hypothetical protein
MCPFEKISLNKEFYWSPVTLLVYDHFIRIWTEKKSQLNESFIKFITIKALDTLYLLFLDTYLSICKNKSK